MALKAACLSMLDSIFGAQPGTWVNLVSKNQAAATPEFVFVSLLSMQQASMTLGVVPGLLSARSVIVSYGRYGASSSTAEVLIP